MRARWRGDDIGRGSEGSSMTRVLVIDDEPSILRALRINLTARDYEVTTAADGTSGLAAVARDRAAGRLVPQRQLLQEVWGPQYESESNYLRVYIAQLRRKLEPEPSRPRYLLTEPGMGYRFQTP